MEYLISDTEQLKPAKQYKNFPRKYVIAVQRRMCKMTKTIICNIFINLLIKVIFTLRVISAF